MKKILAVLLLFALIQVQTFALTIPQGTLVLVQASNTIDADRVKIGDTVSFKTTKPVKVDGKVVINAGKEVNAKVINKKNNGILGIPGEIEVGEFRIITQNNEIIYLDGKIADKGKDRLWANTGWLFIITFPMLFIKGDDGKIYSINEHMLYTAEDVTLEN